jgi:hypothetical protein
MSMTEDEFKLALPPQMKKNVNTALLDKINDIMADDIERDAFRDNIIGMTYILKEGKFKLESYVHAVRYVGFTMMGKNNQESYALTFMDKIAEWQRLGKSAKDISSAVAIYNKSKLVNLVREAAMIPVAIYNADVFQEAINCQATLMRTANSEKVRSDAANSLLTHLKPPEVKKVELDIGVKPDSAIAALRDTTARLVAEQRAMIGSGQASARGIAEQLISSEIIEGEYVDA